MKTGIYCITCAATGRRYVGSSVDIVRRWGEHRFWLRRGQHASPPLQRAWDKYGGSEFQWDILEEVAKERLIEREQFWIDFLKPDLNTGPAFPTRQGVVTSEETKQRQSESQRQRWSDRGDILRQKARERADSMSDEERERKRVAALKASAAAQTEEVREKISAATRRQFEEKGHPRLGTHHSEETKERLREAGLRQQEPFRAERERRQAEFETGREQRERERREKLRAANTGKQQSRGAREKISEAVRERYSDPDQREQTAQAMREKWQDPEYRERMRESHRGKVQSADHVEKRAAAQRGKTRSEETKQRQAEARRQWWAQRKKQSEDSSTD